MIRAEKQFSHTAPAYIDLEDIAQNFAHFFQQKGKRIRQSR